jgi:hypothetical protein
MRRRPLIHRRGSLPALALLGLVLLGLALQLSGRAATGADRSPAPAATPSPAATARSAAVVEALATVQRAFNAGAVKRLCRPGALVDPAVIRRRAAGASGCEAELEALESNAPPMRLTVRGVSVAGDLAAAAVTTARGTAGEVDLVRRGGRWLLSFSDGDDPFPVLAGTG